MDIIISNSSSSPIYEQIKTQIKDKILSGALKEGESLPSMRLLAKELRISIITTKRAYEELEREGLIESFTGKGSFVKKVSKDYLRNTLFYEIEMLLEQVVEKADLAGLSRDDVMEMLEVVYDSEEV